MLNLFLDDSGVEQSFELVRGVFDNVDGPAGAMFFVDVLNGRQGTANDLVCCFHHRLQGLTVRGVAVAIPSSNATCRDTFYCAPVGCGEREPSFPHATQEVQTLSGFLDYGDGVE